MKIYPVLSSDLYVLSCVPVSKLEKQSDDQMRETLSSGGQVKFLVATTCSANVNTATGFMSKHVDYQDISSLLAEEFQIRRVQQAADSLSDYVLKNDMQHAHVYISSIPNPYIISSFQLSNGYIVSMDGYRLSSALSLVVPQMGFSQLSAAVVKAGKVVSPTIDEISSHIPSGSGQLVDKDYVDQAVRKNASSFRGTFQEWSNVPETAVDYELDEYGSHVPDSNDYMVVSQVSSYPYFPASVPAEKRLGSWRFRFTGVWEQDGEESKNKWRPEYSIVNLNMTESQKKVLDSGVTADNRVIRGTAGTNIGDAFTGIYVNAEGKVGVMSHELHETVPSGAKFTDTSAVAGEGVVVTPAGVTQEVSLAYATKEKVGGLKLGNGLSRRGGGNAFVDVSTKVEVVDVEWDDERTVEELAEGYSGWHKGGILIVRRKYALSGEKAHTGYVYDGDVWRAMSGNCCADNVFLPDDIELDGEWSQVGNISNSEGGVFPCGGKSVSEAFAMIFGNGDAAIRIQIPVVTATSFTYDGEEKTPFGEIDSRISVSGDRSATAVGQYSCTFSLPSGEYKWSDGTTEPVVVDWEITPDQVQLVLDSNEP